MSLGGTSNYLQNNFKELNPNDVETYEFEDFRLDAAHLMLYQGGRLIALPPKAVETLVALVERRGEVVGKEELMNRLWGETAVEESNLSQNLYVLRKTLGICADGKPLIETFRRRGYRFNGEIKMPVETELLLATHTKTKTVIEETVEHRAHLSWLLIGGIIIFGVLMLGGFAFLSSGNKPKVAAAAPFQSFKLKRLSETSDITHAVISPDGKFISYTDKKNALWLKNAATGSNVKILPESETIERGVVSISPDDNYIYFSQSFKDKKGEILKMSLFGGGAPQKVTEDSWSGLSLSPDGKQLSFVRLNGETGENAIIVANTDGTGERKAAVNKEGTSFGTWSQSTVWSPDGNRIACTGLMSSEGKEIWVIRIFRAADGAELSLIKPDLNWGWIDSVKWLPDADNLLVIGGDKSSQGQIYKYTISTGEWRRVTNDLSNYKALSVTADGKTVITIQDENLGNLWLLPADGDTRQAKQITFGRNLLTDVTGVSWTPDGKIVYATNAGGRWEIWTIDADGSNQKQLTQNCAGNDTCSQPVVSPDGSYVVFQAARNGVKNIWRMDTDGRNPKQLTEGGGLYPSVTNDGRFVIYTRYTPSSTLWQVPIEGGKSEQFSKIPTAVAASISPDNKQMAFSFYDKTARQPWQTCVAQVGADAPQKCFDFSRSFPRWAADSKAFYYLDHGYAGIWKQPLDGERELFLEFPGERTDNFAFSPDGKSLVVARSQPTQDIVALTEE